MEKNPEMYTLLIEVFFASVGAIATAVSSILYTKWQVNQNKEQIRIIWKEIAKINLNHDTYEKEVSHKLTLIMVSVARIEEQLKAHDNHNQE